MSEETNEAEAEKQGLVDLPKAAKDSLKQMIEIQETLIRQLKSARDEWDKHIERNEAFLAGLKVALEPWIVWNGGKNPVGNVRVQVKLRNGAVFEYARAAALRWDHDEAWKDGNIVKYRVIEGEA